MNRDKMRHYYGDTVRTIFVVSGLIMAVGFPFFKAFIMAPIWLALTACIVLSVFGGLINPAKMWVIILSMIVSVVAFPFFEYSAVFAYRTLTPTIPSHVIFFWINQLLSILFFLAAYLATKTIRGAFIQEISSDSSDR